MSDTDDRADEESTEETVLGEGATEPDPEPGEEAVALAATLGAMLKFDGKFILQTKTDGPVRMIVVDFQAPDRVRACATFDKDRVAAAIAAVRPWAVDTASGVEVSPGKKSQP